MRISHDSLSSVSILASYDAGRSWQTLDSGVFESTWVSSRAGRESSCWFRVEEDGVIDEMTVGFMRNPPPALETDSDRTGTSNPDTLSAVPLSYNSLNTLSDVRVSPLVQSQWSQLTAGGQKCYNAYTPDNCPCGCVATALGQVLRHWQYPVQGVGQVTRAIHVNNVLRSATTRGGNGTGGPYTWNAMPLIPSTASYDAEQWQMIGALCHDAGVGVL